ncbi:MAG: hypothetical protein ACREV5_02320 [Steroidobacter sp.]
MSMPTEELRNYGAIRIALIGYGIAAFTFSSNRAGIPFETGAVSDAMLISGVVLQLLVLASRWLIKRRIRADQRSQTLLIVELLGDGGTVLLFALDTLGGIAQQVSGI